MTGPSIHDLEPQLAANRRYWTGWSGDEPDVDLPIYHSGIPQGLLNGVLRVRNSSLDGAIRQAKRQLDGSPWVWWVGDDSDDGVAEGLLAAGAEQVSLLPIMAMDLAAEQPVPAIPNGLTIRQATDRPDIEAFVGAYAEPMGSPPTASTRWSSGNSTILRASRRLSASLGSSTAGPSQRQLLA
ncbi:hypothetical protein GCM10027614_06810 [Micromonospora vulcania]